MEEKKESVTGEVAKKEAPATIPYVVHEAQMTRAENRERSVWCIAAGLAAAFVVSNLVCLFAITK